MADQRPARGLAPDDALKKWGDPLLYQAMEEFSEWSKDISYGQGHPLADIYPKKHREFTKRRDALEQDLHQKLREGILFGSGIEKGARHREVIDPALWDVVAVDFDFDCIAGNGIVYEAAEIFERSAIPRNIHPPFPEWLSHLASSGEQGFTADPSYTHVTNDGVTFQLGPTRARVVRLLHEAVRRGEPWQNGKKLLQDAGSTQTKVGDVFKTLNGWRRLIVSDGRGSYRLKVSDPQ